MFGCDTPFREDFVEDDIKMTFQIALMGNDGFIIASDRKATRGGTLKPDFTYTMRSSSDTRKILVSENNEWVCACSGTETVFRVARKLLASMGNSTESDVRAALESKAEEIFKSYSPPLQQSLSFGELTIARVGVSELWQVSFALGTPLVSAASSRFFGGDKGNPAVLYAERYLATQKDKSVEELKLLAAFTVLEGGFLNPTGVGGLDVLISKQGEKPRFLKDEELQILCERSKSLHKLIAVEIFQENKKPEYD